MSSRHTPTRFARVGPVALILLALLLVFSGATAAVQRPRERHLEPNQAATLPPVMTLPIRPIVRFEPDPVQVGLGQVSEVDIVVENASGLYAAEIRVSFPADLVEVRDAYPGVAGIQVEPGNVFDGYDTYTIQNIVSPPNLIEYIVSITGSRVGTLGNGKIATISLFGTAVGSATLTFEEVILCERSGTSMLVQVPSESVDLTVTGQTSTPTVTKTSTPTSTATESLEPTLTATMTATEVGTLPAGPTATGTITSTATASPTLTATSTGTITTTETPTPTPTATGTGALETPTPVCSDGIINGGFEDIAGNDAPPWVRVGATTYTSVEQRSGAYCAWLGGYNGANDHLYQDVSIPSHTVPGEQLTKAVLRYSWGMFTEELSHPFDFMRINVKDLSGIVLEELEEVHDGSESGTWQDREFDLSAYEGQDIRISFDVTADGTNATNFYVDDVSLEICEVIMPTVTSTSEATATDTLTPTTTETVSTTTTVTATLTSTATPTVTSTTAPAMDPITDTLQAKDGVYDGCEDSYFSAWDSPPANYGAQGAMSIRTAGVKRPVIRFEMPGSMSGATVLNATLSLYTSHYKSHAHEMAVSVYGLNKPFGEMETTWADAASSTPWTLGGADSVTDDRDGVAQDTVTVSDINSWYDWDVTALVQEWLDGTRSNDGMILIAGGNTVEMSFWSTEYSLPDLHPKLTISYVFGGQQPEPSPTSEHSPTPGPSPTFTVTPTPQLGGTTVTYQQDQLGYQGVRDTYMSSWQPDTNYGGSVSLLVRQGDIRSSLIKFGDLNLPANATIHEATLQLYAVSRSNAGNTTIEAYPVLRAWTDTQATWNIAKAGTAWGLAGCNLVGTDRVGVPVDSVFVDGVEEWFEWNVTSTVQDWVSGASTNRGVVLRGTGMTSVEYLFASSEYWWASGLTPRLVIRYSVP